MSQECVEKFIGRLITDDTFRKTVWRQFRQICREEGFVLNSLEEEALMSLDPRLFDGLSSRIDGAIRRCGKGL